MTNDLPPWFKDVVLSGIQMLVVLRLSGTPAAEIIGLTGTVWLNVIWKQNVKWNEQQDHDRIEQGFFILAQRSEYWPAPIHLIKAMPPREKPKALPLPEVSEQKAKENLEKLRALTAQCHINLPDVSKQKAKETREKIKALATESHSNMKKQDNKND